MEHVSNTFCFANITHKIVQKHTEYATQTPIKTTSSVAGRRTHAVSLCRTFAKCRIPHLSLAAKKLSFAERHFPQLCDSDYTETAPVLTSPSLEGAEDTYIIYATTLHADPMSARIDALFYISTSLGTPSWAIHPGSGGSRTKFLTDGSWA